jgi:hypothetical protein
MTNDNLGHNDLLLITAVLGKVTGAPQAHPPCLVMLRRLFALVQGGERDFDALRSAAVDMRENATKSHLKN